MMLRLMALRRLRSLASGVADDVPAGPAAQHGGRCARAGVLAMREGKLAAATRAAAARLRRGMRIDGHGRKRTTPKPKTSSALAW